MTLKLAALSALAGSLIVAVAVQAKPTNFIGSNCNNNGHCNTFAKVALPISRGAVRSLRRHRLLNTRSRPRPRPVYDANANIANANVVSHKTGAKARVASRYAARFQAYVDDLEAHGASVRFMGGYRKGHGSIRHLHPWGMALDVCQVGRGRVDQRCHLPGRRQIASIAARHGLFEGGQWCSSDYGHAQVGMTAPPCGQQIILHRRWRYASRR